MNKTTYFECACYSHEHFLKMTIDEDLPYHVIIAMHLSPLPLYRRIINAISYVFGRRSKYGDFEELILKPDEIKNMQKFLQSVLYVVSPVSANTTELPEGV